MESSYYHQLGVETPDEERHGNTPKWLAVCESPGKPLASPSVRCRTLGISHQSSSEDVG